MLGVAQLWHLALSAFLLGLASSMDEPARAWFFARLVPDGNPLFEHTAEGEALGKLY